MTREELILELELYNQNNKVIFKEEEHEYWLGDKQLSGITKHIQERLYGGNKYAGVSKELLERSAEYGKIVHKEIEEFINFGHSGFSTELENFKSLIVENNITPIISELTVTDNNIFATNVDILAQDNDTMEVELIDVKTTSKIDIPYLRWQLSINAYFLEKNSNIKVGRLKAFATRENVFYPLARHTNEEVEEFLYGNIEADKQGLMTQEQHQRLIDTQSSIKSLKAQIEALEEYEQRIKEMLAEKMKNAGIKSHDFGDVKITYMAPSTRKSLDSTRIKEELPELYEKYSKESITKESVRITVREK